MPTKRRRHSYGQMDPDDLDEDEEALDVDDDDPDELGLGPVGALELEGVGAPPQSSIANGKRRSLSTSTAKANRPDLAGPASNSALPLQHRWEIDSEALDQLPSAPRASFRQCIQSHTDWVNDIVLANYNRTLVSASSDSSILAWHPHSSDHHDQMTPTTIGRHADYVRCLATGLDTNWVASGGFDRKIKLWDVGEGRANAPIGKGTFSVARLGRVADFFERFCCLQSSCPVRRLPSIRSVPPRLVRSLQQGHQNESSEYGTLDRVRRSRGSAAIPTTCERCSLQTMANG